MNRLGLLLGMGLAGILTIALIVSADQTYAGIDGLRAVTAYPPASEQDPVARPSVPILTGLVGLLEGIRELPLFGLSPAAPASPASSSGPAAPSSGPAGSSQPGSNPSFLPPAGPTAPAPTAPTGTPKPSTTPAPSASPTPGPSSTPTSGPSSTPAAAPSATPTPAPTATPTPTPAPTLAVATNRGATAIITLGDLVPGDTIDRTITLKNTGNLGLRYAVSATQTASTPLWTDLSNGLQLTVSAFDGTVLYSGPLSSLGSLASATTLAPGDTELLRYTFTLPAGAPNTFQGLLQDLTIVFTATQYP